MLSAGPAALSDGELLAVLLRTGTSQMNVLDVARTLLLKCNNSLVEMSRLSTEQLCAVPGIKKDKAREKELINNYVDKFAIKITSPNQLAGKLSGGNQQKVVLAKWLASDASILIFDEPTRGIDVGAKWEIYNLMNALCQKGMSIIMISSEMEELLGMSDRIVVLYEGRQMGTLEKKDFSQETVLTLASGEEIA